jgi:hypothetical protein
MLMALRCYYLPLTQAVLNRRLTHSADNFYEVQDNKFEWYWMQHLVGFLMVGRFLQRHILHFYFLKNKRAKNKNN